MSTDFLIPHKGAMVPVTSVALIDESSILLTNGHTVSRGGGPLRIVTVEAERTVASLEQALRDDDERLS